jgi:radical SAM protein with 4Fe4S-binding SPASM domain
MDKFMAYSPFSYELCVNCKLLPKCWGGCMFKREYIKTDMCPYWKHSYELLITEKFALEGVKND